MHCAGGGGVRARALIIRTVEAQISSSGQIATLSAESLSLLQQDSRRGHRAYASTPRSRFFSPRERIFFFLFAGNVETQRAPAWRRDNLQYLDRRRPREKFRRIARGCGATRRAGHLEHRYTLPRSRACRSLMPANLGKNIFRGECAFTRMQGVTRDACKSSHETRNKASESVRMKRVRKQL